MRNRANTPVPTFFHVCFMSFLDLSELLLGDRAGPKLQLLAAALLLLKADNNDLLNIYLSFYLYI